jgi:protein SCO1/2
MKRLLLALALAFLVPAAVLPADLATAGRNYFTDVLLTNQNGEKMRLYSDLIAGKTVVINSFYSTCVGICPIMGGTFKRIQSALGDRLGRDVILISVTVDPETDTPAKLRDYAKSMSAKPGWYFVTGDRKSVEQALQKLGLLVEAKDDHKAIMIIGNEPKGVWKKAFGLAKSDDIVKMVEEVVAAQ